MTHNRLARLFLFLVLGSGFDVSLSTIHAAEVPTVATVSGGRGLLEWTLQVEPGVATLALSDPRGVVRTHHFPPGEVPSLSLFDTKGMPLADGTYTWELRVMPRLGANLGKNVEDALRQPHIQSGYFTLSNGNLVAPDQAEPPDGRQRSSANSSVDPMDQIVPDDFIVDGKGCIGLGCNNNEAFGPEALRLKQSVVRLRFEDTSNQAGFPARDWQLVANDAASGGADRFSIEDLTAGTVPLTLRGGAPSNSLFVDVAGNIGLGTAVPAVDLHLSGAAAQTVRLEKTGAPASTWDLTADNSSFRLVDVTNASVVPLRVTAAAPTNSIAVTAAGFVGLGTASPVAQVHVFGNAPGVATTKLFVQNTSSVIQPRELFELQNNGSVAFIFKDLTVPERWAFQGFSHSFIIDNQANGGIEYNFGPVGNLIMAGNLTAANFPSSSRTLKENFDEIDPVAVLNRLISLPISEWSFRADPEHRRHIGPTVEDFQTAFGMGTHGQSLVITDVGGVALASLQGLHTLVERQHQAIEKQKELIGRLEERLRRLEAQDHPEPKSTVQR